MHSLTTKLVLAFLAVTLIGVLLVVFFIGRQTERAFDRFLLDRNQEQMLAILTRYYEVNGSWENLDAWWTAERIAFAPPSRRDHGAGDGPAPFWGLVADSAGTVILPANRRGEPMLTRTERDQAIPIYGTDNTPDAGQVVGYVLFDRLPFVPGVNTPESIFLARLRQATVWGAIGATLVALLAAVLLARTITRPVVALTQAARTVTAGELGHQVPVRSNDEIGELTQAFNQMSASLDQSVRQRKQMTADIAHDLRTPLSIILGYTEALSDGKLRGTPELFSTVHGEAQHLNHLIDDLRILSLADTGELTLNRVPVPPVDLLTRAAAAHLVLAEQRGITIDVRSEEALPSVSVDVTRMVQVFNNLLVNALRHTPDGGHIDLTARREDGTVILAVRDSGEGFAPADLPHIFDRFYRGDKSRAGNDESGLGLPIVRSIVAAHSGTVQAHNGADGGAELSVILPGWNADLADRADRRG